MSNTELNISLEKHLQETLAPLSDILPRDISSQLPSNPHNLDLPQPRTVPYSLLLSISKWSRTPAGLEGLKEHKLSPNDYTMIALLAGTTTSPERSFPAYVASDPVADQERDNRDRKAITALVNAVLSVLGSGGATWWAVANIGWQPEWKVLLSFLVAAVVGVSETILYIIWESRKAAKGPRKTRRLKASHKKKDEEPVVDGSGDTKLDIPENLRQRLTVGTDDDPAS